MTFFPVVELPWNSYSALNTNLNLNVCKLLFQVLFQHPQGHTELLYACGCTLHWLEASEQLSYNSLESQVNAVFLPLCSLQMRQS